MAMNIKNPLFPGAGPFLLYHEGMYYIYCTSENSRWLLEPNAFDTDKNGSDGFDVYSSSDLQNWQCHGFCLTKENVMGEKWFWAPEVYYHNGKFYMLYSSEEHMAIAVSDSPLGPFVAHSDGWLREIKSIDGHLMFDDNGDIYIYYVRLEYGNQIHVAKMSQDLKRIEKDDDILLIKAEEPWESMDCLVAEGPYVLKHKGKYYMTYSCNHTRSPDYAMGYAVAECPTGPFVKYEGNPILHRNGKIVGVGHSSMCVNPDKGIMLCAYHCHNIDNENFKPRQTCIAPAWFIEKEGCDDVLCVENP
jgi:beta-xylosidase